MKIATQFAGLGVIAIVLNLAVWGAIGCAAWWGYNHVIAPSFGTHKLEMH